MKGRRGDTPNLDDVLARDFAELKVGEENIEVDSAAEIQEEVPSTPPSPPIVYNQRIDAVEDRESFAVKAPQQQKPTREANDTEKETVPSQTILNAPSTQMGDDFDVDW